MTESGALPRIPRCASGGRVTEVWATCDQDALLSQPRKLEAGFPASKLLEFLLPLGLAIKDVLGREVSWGTAWLLEGEVWERERGVREGRGALP